MQTHQPKPGNGAASLYAGLRIGGRTGGMSFRQVDGETLRACVDAVVQHGDAILFGRTSDAGALSVRVLSQGRTECWYPTDASELQELLESLTAIVSA